MVKKLTKLDLRRDMRVEACERNRIPGRSSGLSGYDATDRKCHRSHQSDTDWKSEMRQKQAGRPESGVNWFRGFPHTLLFKPIAVTMNLHAGTRVRNPARNPLAWNSLEFLHQTWPTKTEMSAVLDGKEREAGPVRINRGFP
jgi:hypothetical protein